MVASSIPDRGDIVWLDFSPQVGHEQKGRRPALVLSPKSYNKKVGLLIACPVTSNKKGYPFEVELPDSIKVDGVLLADQVKSLDWRERNAEIEMNISKEVVNEVLEKLSTLLI